MARDVTARKAAERHLEQMEGQYRGLLEAAPDAMVVVDQSGAIVLVNVQAETQFGYRRDELLGQPVTNIIPEGFAERLVTDATRSETDALAQEIGAEPMEEVPGWASARRLVADERALRRLLKRGAETPRASATAAATNPAVRAKPDPVSNARSRLARMSLEEQAAALFRSMTDGP